MTDVDGARRVRRRVSIVVALATAFSSANLYYVQPLLPMLAAESSTTESVVGLLNTLMQVGFIAGVVLVLPLGDVLNRLKLVPALMLVVASAQLVTALIGNLYLVMATAVPIGVGSVAAQVLVQYAGDLAKPDRRAAVVARTVGALLAGILLARFFSGALADVLGWRAVYFASALILVLLGAALWRSAPDDCANTSFASGYAQLVRSTPTLILTQPWLAQAAVIGAVTFGAFNLFWTALPFHLAAAPMNWSTVSIGAVSLVGIGGIAVANVVGKTFRRGVGRPVTGCGVVATMLAFVCMLVDARSVVLILMAAIILDLGVQAVHAVNQCTVADRAGTHRSRANAVYMSSYFLGGAAGSALATAAYGVFGMAGIGGAGLVLGVLGLGFWLTVGLQRPIRCRISARKV